MVGFGAGGGTDFAGRLVASFWSDFMGGNARVKNMPGGGSLVATNFVWKSKPDGLTLLVCPAGTGIAAPFLFESEGMEFDIAKLQYIGMYADEPWTFSVGTDLPYNSVADLQKTDGFKQGTPAKVGGPPTGCALAAELIPLKNGTVISGYKSTPAIGLAIAQGEIQGFVIPAGSCKGEVDKGNVKAIVNIGFVKSPLFPDVPPLSEVIDLTPEQEKLLKLYTDGLKAGRVLAAPPGVPKDRIDFLRQAFDKLMVDKGVVKFAKARYKVFEPHIPGAEYAEIVKGMTTTPQADIDKLKALIDKYVK